MTPDPTPLRALSRLVDAQGEAAQEVPTAGGDAGGDAPAVVAPGVGSTLPAEAPYDDEFDVADGSRVGFVHSTETTSGVNGPGLRYTVFLSGCGLRCLYCHNPDTQGMRLGERTSATRVIEEVGRYLAFIRRHGGLTVTGGEPLLQPGFVEELFVGVKSEYGLHTTLDTAANNQQRASDRLLAHTDLVLLDIKAGNAALYERVTGGGSLADVMAFGARLLEHDVAVWVRFVLVPGLTDAPEHIAQVADRAAELGPIVQRVEVLPYHRLGVAKYAALGRPYPLEGTPTPTHGQVEQALAIFRERGLVALA
ncbi:MAG TPA: pyruvate formate-lyase-activating protein [Candidatus Nanopelagicales bacterium]